MPDRPESSSLPDLVTDLKDLVVGYAKQETVVPIKNLGRFLAFGVAGSVLVAIGVVLLVLAVLRGLQTELSSTFDGDLSFAPYLITVVLCAIVAGLGVRGIGAAKRRAKRS